MDLQILSSSIPGFSLAKDGERGWLSKMHTKYRETVVRWKDIESGFYSNSSPNEDLEN
jgi:hypothetical protein